ncbi:DNA-3-methyladenine glycosylase [Legionella yabuuchiae]|uniref:DNA-3-methyladenine glycosylase n=1 Tax=Legionella yabuuchiae TaxID=376727 RepID=UPI001054E2EB|nr:DNA-3-methyladenine glycosylase [Legionella yabuuchiae]
MEKLSRDFYKRDTLTVAKDLLGKYLVHNKEGIEQIGRIVEVEAYLGEHDLAAHSSKGLTNRTKVMFGPPGYAYVYMIYGLHYCFNVVTEEKGHGSAVLIRALEPIKNISQNTKGPALLCKALSIDKALYGHDLFSDDFYIAEPAKSASFTIISKARIGVDYAKEWAKRPLRFYIKDNPFISKL